MIPRVPFAALLLAHGKALPPQLQKYLTPNELQAAQDAAQQIKQRYPLSGQDKNPHQADLTAQRKALARLNPGALDPNAALPDSNQVISQLPSQEAVKVHAVESQYMQNQANNERLSNREALAASKLRKRK